MLPAPLSIGFDFHSTTHNQIGPLWCWFPSGVACACSRPLWVSPTTSPVRLGVSPAAAPTPTGVFNQRFEALFPHTGALGCASALLPALCPVYLHECGATGSASGQTTCPVGPTLQGPAKATQVLSTPAVHLHPSYQSG